MDSQVSKIYEFNESVDFMSSAIKKVVAIINETEQKCFVIFNSGNKEYEYMINDSEFVDNLRYTVINDKSMGQFITSSIRNGKLTQLNINIQ